MRKRRKKTVNVFNFKSSSYSHRALCGIAARNRMHNTTIFSFLTNGPSKLKCYITLGWKVLPMEQYAFNNVNNCLNTNIYSYLETSGGQSSNPY